MDFKKILIYVKKKLQVDVLDNLTLERIYVNIEREILKEMKIKKIGIENLKYDTNASKTFRKMEFNSMEEVQNYLINFCDKAFPTFENILILGDLILSAEKVILDVYNDKKIKKDGSNITTIKIKDSDMLIIEIHGAKLGYDKLKVAFDEILNSLRKDMNHEDRI